jgi:hypothetical protein
MLPSEQDGAAGHVVPHRLPLQAPVLSQPWATRLTAAVTRELRGSRQVPQGHTLVSFPQHPLDCKHIPLQVSNRRLIHVIPEIMVNKSTFVPSQAL